jgi:hypothetical protein
LSNKKQRAESKSSAAKGGRSSKGKMWLALVLGAGLVASVPAWKAARGPQRSVTALVPATSVAPAESATVSPKKSESVEVSTNEVAHALMVTVELEFGGRLPSIKEALRDVERRYEPEDGQGRTFAILDAYGEPAPSGKLHMSMHVSMEKPGLGALVFRPTGQVLWKSRIVPSKTPAPVGKDLTIVIDDGAGNSQMLDGSKGAMGVLDVPLRGTGTLVRDVWPEGNERELTFIYSACGCPVKVKVRRAGETTVRSGELPVMFPDDPAAMTVINRLMGWSEG